MGLWRRLFFSFVRVSVDLSHFLFFSTFFPFCWLAGVRGASLVMAFVLLFVFVLLFLFLFFFFSLLLWRQEVMMPTHPVPSLCSFLWFLFACSRCLP
jgi:uncharacterized membrane protein